MSTEKNSLGVRENQQDVTRFQRWLSVGRSGPYADNNNINKTLAEKQQEETRFQHWLEAARAGPDGDSNNKTLDCCYLCLQFYKYPTEIDSCDKCARPFCRNCVPKVVLRKCHYPPYASSSHSYCSVKCSIDWEINVFCDDGCGIFLAIHNNSHNSC